MQQTSSLDPNIPWSVQDVYKEEQISPLGKCQIFTTTSIFR